MKMVWWRSIWFLKASTKEWEAGEEEELEGGRECRRVGEGFAPFC